ncbi:uncharacterized protein LOC133814583 [Humulus lupulus]|uniref:uncharacterized protein LOC133814583 n=1 Tax=Humulus lupulus TaxID=3486 RepID=UPI002B41821C|nr:uncharacterized protein LOC133814583 [Humulus lupulus]
MLVPWNHGEHWMLLILAPYAYHVYCCDPVNSELNNREEIVSVIVSAFNLFFSMNLPDVEILDTLRIKQPQCPHQPDNVACGYYLMRMLKDLIEHVSPGQYLRTMGASFFNKLEVHETRSLFPSRMYSNMDSTDRSHSSASIGSDPPSKFSGCYFPKC